jgi:hypothetical protein
MLRVVAGLLRVLLLVKALVLNDVADVAGFPTSPMTYCFYEVADHQLMA